MMAEQLVSVARGFVDTPFHHGARLPGVGLDCIGVIVCAAAQCGIAHRDVAAYPLRPNGQLPRELDAQLEKVSSPEPGDVLLMSFDDGTAHHLALYTGESIIHAYTQVRRCVEQPYTDFWRGKTRAVYRFRELT
jgi:cell wall-associated NlpC family hydrolase